MKRSATAEEERVLAPSALALVDAPAAERELFLEKEVIFPTPDVERVIGALSHSMELPRKSRMDHFLIEGPPNSGKSHIYKRFAQMNRFVPRPDCVSDHQPVINVEITNASESRLIDALYAAQGTGLSLKTPNAKLPAIIATMRARDTKMIAVDEANRTALSSLRIRKQFVHTALYIASETKSSLALFGTDARDIITLDDQVYSRFKNGLFTLGRWPYDDDWMELMKGFEMWLPLRERSNLHYDELALRIHDLSLGLIGEAHKVIKMAACAAMEDGSERITMAILTEIPFIRMDSVHR